MRKPTGSIILLLILLVVSLYLFADGIRWQLQIDCAEDDLECQEDDKVVMVLTAFAGLWIIMVAFAFLA